MVKLYLRNSRYGLRLRARKGRSRYLLRVLAGIAYEDKITAFPFVQGIDETDGEVGRISKSAPDSTLGKTEFCKPGDVKRLLLPCTDTYKAFGCELTVYTPYYELGTKLSARNADFKILPSVLVKMSVINKDCAREARGFFAIKHMGPGRIRTFENTDSSLCGVAYKDEWGFAAYKSDTVGTVRNFSIARYLQSGEFFVHDSGNEGGISFKVASGKSEDIYIAVGFYDSGRATTGIDTKYLYTKLYSCIEDVLKGTLEKASYIESFCKSADEGFTVRADSQKDLELFSQSRGGYYANGSLLYDKNGRIYYSVCEGQYLWKNTLDLAVDFMYYELDHAKFAAKNVLSLYLDRYNYTDRVRFDDSGYHDGGLCFTHDMGNYTTFCVKEGNGAYERLGSPDDYTKMTTEKLVNGIIYYCGYILRSGDVSFRKKYGGYAVRMIESLNNRDASDENKRDGILKAVTDRVGKAGRECTTYDSLDKSLYDAKGSTYIAFKTLAAELLLRETFRLLGDEKNALACDIRFKMTGESICRVFDKDRELFSCNTFNGSKAAVISILEGVSVIGYFGLADELKRNGELYDDIVKHIHSCLKTSGCVGQAGGLKLSGDEPVTWFSKAMLAEYAVSRVMNTDTDKLAPKVNETFYLWAQKLCAEKTLTDQLNADKNEIVGGWYYPRQITSYLRLRKE